MSGVKFSSSGVWQSQLVEFRGYEDEFTCVTFSAYCESWALASCDAS